jgi:phosphoenolpyruvate-protein phosphotransferase (PTS system enzyme I)
MEKFFKGVPASRKIAIGTAVVFLKSNIFIPKHSVVRSKESLDKEKDKLESALMKTKRQLEDLRQELSENQTTLETGFIDTSLLMLDDPLIREKVSKKLLETSLNIEWVFNGVMEEIAGKLHESEDSYFRERAPDVVSLGHKVLKNMMGDEELDLPAGAKNPVVLCHTLSPPEFIYFYKRNMRAVVTEIGGKTSHVAIMARDLEIPAVVGVEDATKHVQTGDPIIVDGNVGTVILNPEKDTVVLYSFKRKENERYEKHLKKIEKKACVLKEGTEVELLANLDVEEELELIHKNFCRGIGLFRTEYIFLNRDKSPSEDEQVEIYRKIVKKLAPTEVTIRSIDIGGDKKPPYMQYYEEKNPFLGWRGIRFALSHMDILKDQIRAILRASTHGKTRIMFPMVNDIDETREILRVLEECKGELSEKKIPFDDKIPFGIMVETPASVILLDRIAELIDFVSVGTNDLIQYTLAIDRGNGMVASEFDPTHPAILRSLKLIADICTKKGLELSICGEMAGYPLYTLLLIGLGYRKLSMSMPSIPLVKNIVINSSLEDAEKLAGNALEISSKSEVNRYIKAQMIGRFKDLEDYFRSNA